MSADNGIYVAEFPDGWRVIHAQAIDNLTYFPEGSKEYFQEIKNYFNDADFFETEQQAIAFAFELTKKYDILEYGIQYLGQLPNWE